MKLKLKVVAESPLTALSLLIPVRKTGISEPPAEQELAGHQDKERRSAAPLCPQDPESLTQPGPVSPLQTQDWPEGLDGDSPLGEKETTAGIIFQQILRTLLLQVILPNARQLSDLRKLFSSVEISLSSLKGKQWRVGSLQNGEC